MFGMNETGKVDALLEKLKEDSAEYKELETEGYSLEEKKKVIRSLMNIRMPGALSDELVGLQDKYLQGEQKSRGIVRLVDIPTIKEAFNSKDPYAEKVSLWQGDITRLELEKELLFDDFNKFIDYPYHQKLKEVRTELHMTQVEFAAFSGINRSTLSAWEQGTWIPTRENYILLAEAFKKASEIKED